VIEIGENILPAVAGVPSYTTISEQPVRITPLNNAATTPPFERTLDEINVFMHTYGALHRGAGPRARATCEAVEAAIDSIRRFIGAGDHHALLFTQNTSAAINLLARLLALRERDIVITSEIEHTSNNLPWRYNTVAEVMEMRASDDGALDYEHLEALCAEHRGYVRAICVSGASNQTGYVANVARLSSIAHETGAVLFVDAAQLAPHRAIDMCRDGIDALAFSAHKVYAPFGLGVLALPRELLARIPVEPGGGSIDMISADRVVWSPLSERHQTGTWNVTGIVALAASCRALEETGWETILNHEDDLVVYTSACLSLIPTLRMHVRPGLYAAQRRIGTFPFTLGGYHHALLAAILEHEFGIEVRAGTICNHRLVRRWFEVSDEQQEAVEDAMSGGNRLASYGIVRASLALYNTREDIDTLAGALTAVAQDGPRRSYRPVPAEETYVPC
jgi:cysteine desulfurase / selenocysteine lyase